MKDSSENVLFNGKFAFRETFQDIPDTEGYPCQPLFINLFLTLGIYTEITTNTSTTTTTTTTATTNNNNSNNNNNNNNQRYQCKKDKNYYLRSNF